MHIFYKILSIIHASLLNTGLPLPKFRKLFNQPVNKNTTQFQAIIFGDKSFTSKERKLILDGLEDLHYMCNGLIAIDIVFDLDLNDAEKIKNNNVLIRAEESDPAISKADGYFNYDILGLCEYFKNNTVRLHLVHKRLRNPFTFKTTTIHEFGHMIGLDHTDKHSIMHKHNNGDIGYPNYIDAKEIARVWDIEIDNLKYYKL